MVALTQLSATDLAPLFEEEVGVWEREFSWDFRPSTDLLRRFLQIQSLTGYALRAQSGITGYAYHVCEGRKGLIGDFFVRASDTRSADEILLLGAVVEELIRTPGIRRIESQLMILHAALPQQIPFSRYLTRYERQFMEISREAIAAVPSKPVNFSARFAPWGERLQEDVVHVVAASYRGHIDSEINDQYRTIPGARQFLMNIIKFPGCGRFSADASMVAIDDRTGRLCAACLASMVAPQSGHITQLCVLPAVRGARLGSQLLRQTLLKLSALGCTSVSLTVTSSNRDAIALYESMGFRSRTTFPALVWEGF